MAGYLQLGLLDVQTEEIDEVNGFNLHGGRRENELHKQITQTDYETQEIPRIFERES